MCARWRACPTGGCGRWSSPGLREHPGGFRHSGLAGRRPKRPDSHQHRRSLRASWLLFAWLSVLDPSSINTIDSYIEEGGRHFVRHYFFDFGCAFGSATNYAQGMQRTANIWSRSDGPWAPCSRSGCTGRPSDRRDEWQRLTAEHPALGYFPAESFDPDNFRTNRKLPSHMRLTDRDAYWGAKLVTAFSDEQIAALVRTARLPEADARYIERGLRRPASISSAVVICAPSPRWRRPTWPGRHPPSASRIWPVSRGYAEAGRASVTRSRVEDGLGQSASSPYAQQATGPAACLPIGGTGRGSGYRVVQIRARFLGDAGPPASTSARRARASALARADRAAS